MPVQSRTWVYVTRAYYQIVSGKIELDYEGDPLEYTETYFSEHASLSEWLAPFSIPVSDDIWKNEAISSQERVAHMPDMAYEIGDISDSIRVLVNVGDYGVEKQIYRPLSEHPSGRVSNTVAYSELKANNTYKIEGNLTVLLGTDQNPVQSLDAIKYLEGLTVVRVIKVSTTCEPCSPSNPWYFVSLPGYEDINAWINSTALMSLSIAR